MLEFLNKDQKELIKLLNRWGCLTSNQLANLLNIDLFNAKQRLLRLNPYSICNNGKTIPKKTLILKRSLTGKINDKSPKLFASSCYANKKYGDGYNHINWNFSSIEHQTILIDALLKFYGHETIKCSKNKNIKIKNKGKNIDHNKYFLPREIAKQWSQIIKEEISLNTKGRRKIIRRIPDTLITNGNKKIAIEIENSPKTKQRYHEICYSLSRFQGRKCFDELVIFASCENNTFRCWKSFLEKCPENEMIENTKLYKYWYDKNYTIQYEEIRINREIKKQKSIFDIE
jgi:hypothetical protein